jgi:hypothetical protein
LKASRNSDPPSCFAPTKAAPFWFLEPLRLAEKVLAAIIQKTYIQCVLTRSGNVIDIDGISRGHISGLCAIGAQIPDLLTGPSWQPGQVVCERACMSMQSQAARFTLAE